MIRIPGQSIIEILRHIRRGGPEWANRTVTLRFPAPSDAWALVYPLQHESSPYFDFMYTREESPQVTLAALLKKYPQCTVIDWSPGRLACIQAIDVDVQTLAEIIRDAVETVVGEHVAPVEAWYKEMGRA